MFLVALYSLGFVTWLGFQFWEQVRSAPTTGVSGYLRATLTGLGVFCALIASIKLFF